MLLVLALLHLASSLSPAMQAEPPRSSTSLAWADLQSPREGIVADSVFYLVSGSLPCEAFEPIMESLVRRPDVREFVGSDCSGGQMDMVVEFEFASESELVLWQLEKETRDMLSPVFRTLKPLRLQIRATPRDPSAVRSDRGATPHPERSSR